VWYCGNTVRRWVASLVANSIDSSEWSSTNSLSIIRYRIFCWKKNTQHWHVLETCILYFSVLNVTVLLVWLCCVYMNLLSIYCSIVLCWASVAFSVSWYFTQSVGLLGRDISPSPGRYLRTGQHEYRIKAHRHPRLKWYLNPRSQSLSERKTVHVLHHAATVIRYMNLQVYYNIYRVTR
jgi:hypothetical protein